ncbi:MAG: HAMP domain-containing sensor histidine kinase [Candidatus Paceibacterota bacterium]
MSDKASQESNSPISDLLSRIFQFRLTIIAETMTLFILLVIISQTLFLEHVEDVILTIIVFSFASFVGAFLVYSVRALDTQRDESVKLAEYLRNANIQLRQIDKMKSEFVYLATHQIRTPLTSIRGYLSMILEGDYGRVPERLESPIHMAFVSSKEMVDTIEYFLNVTRIERGQLDYDMELFDMRRLVESTANQMRPIIERAGLNMHLDIDEHNDYTVKGDADKLRQVITNLIDNGIQYTKEGSVSIHLWKYDEKVRIEVKDTGVGLSKKDKEHVFMKFGRADDAEKYNVFGVGLGLYISKRVISDHEGTLLASSLGRGKGTTFVVELKAISTKQEHPKENKENREMSKI